MARYLEWSTFCTTAPPGTAGVALPHRPGYPSMRFVVQVAPLFLANVDPRLTERTQPYWVDVTPHLVSLSMRRGSTVGAESRWPVGQLTVDLRVQLPSTGNSLGDMLGDWTYTWPTPAPTTPGAGALIRWGFFTAGVWSAQFTGVIDNIREEDAAPVPWRVWRVTAFDTLYWLAGKQPGLTYATTAGTSVSAELDWLLSYPTAGDWPFPVTIPTLSTPVVGANYTELLPTAHRLADSAGHKVYATGTGRLQVSPWDIGAATAPAFTTDELGAGAGGSRGRARATWVSSPMRVAAFLLAKTGSGTVRQIVTDYFAAGLWPVRTDTVDWPKEDLFTRDTADVDALLAGAVDRYKNPHHLESLTIDTLKNHPGAWDQIMASGINIRVHHIRNRPTRSTDTFPIGLNTYMGGNPPKYALDVLGRTARFTPAPVPRMVVTLHTKLRGYAT